MYSQASWPIDLHRKPNSWPRFLDQNPHLRFARARLVSQIVLAKVPAAELFATDGVVHADTHVHTLASPGSLVGAAPSGIVAVVVLVAHAACLRARLLV